MGAGSAAPMAIPASPPPTQYTWYEACIANSRSADRSDSGRAAAWTLRAELVDGGCTT